MAEAVPVEVKQFIEATVRQEMAANKPYPDKHFEVVIVYNEQDYEEVKRYREEILDIAEREKNLKDVKIALYDDATCFQQSKVKVVDELLRKSYCLMFYMTANSNTPYFNYIFEEAFARVTFDKNPTDESPVSISNALVVVHSLPRKERNYSVPVGMTSINSIDWFDKKSAYTRDKVKAILTNGKHIKSRQERDTTRREFSFAYQQLRRQSGAAGHSPVVPRIEVPKMLRPLTIPDETPTHPHALTSDGNSQTATSELPKMLRPLTIPDVRDTPRATSTSPIAVEMGYDDPDERPVEPECQDFSARFTESGMPYTTAEEDPGNDTV